MYVEDSLLIEVELDCTVDCELLIALLPLMVVDCCEEDPVVPVAGLGLPMLVLEADEEVPPLLDILELSEDVSESRSFSPKFLY